MQKYTHTYRFNVETSIIEINKWLCGRKKMERNWFSGHTVTFDTDNSCH